jgi:nicotinamide-nucleotide amidase
MQFGSMLKEMNGMATQAQRLLAHLEKYDLRLVTAESCTAGMIIALLSDVPGSGSLIDCGYVVYSEQAKKRLLRVKSQTIKRYSLTSEEVAREMAIGALRDSTANTAIATTGITGPEAMDGIPPGTICFAWAFHITKKIEVFSETRRFKGDRSRLRTVAAQHALKRFAYFHRQILYAP